ncbi:hypothetical protein AXF42_Ash002624 [Apostasia shenzhenica]|uniref:Uncharacterized protein n=1 Tax=Apostasia shenzhenica TaxID=1088818 RepID=A0A2I0AP35_9ASPA|nr:hypothetical protein AXF42_Ash002624 [Apostasia shenzhenica]
MIEKQHEPICNLPPCNVKMQLQSGPCRQQMPTFQIHTKQPQLLRARRSSRCSCRKISSGGGGAPLTAAADVKEAAVSGLPEEEDDIAGIKLLLLDEAAPSLGEDVALAAAPVGVAEPPRPAAFILEAQQQPLLAGASVQREILLGVLFGDHQPVQLPDVARRQGLLKHGLLLEAHRSSFFFLRRPPMAFTAAVGCLPIKTMLGSEW